MPTGSFLLAYSDRVSSTRHTSLPWASRATRRGLHLFVNGRFVRDRLVAGALYGPYRGLIPEGRFPVAILFLAGLPSFVAEAKFSGDAFIFAIFSA